MITLFNKLFMFIRKRTSKLKNGDTSISYQAIVKVRKGDKLVRKAVSLGEYPNPIEALDWERKVLERARISVEYPIDQYKEIRHSARYNRPMVVSVPIKTAKKKRIFWVELYKKQKKRVEMLEKVVSDLYQKKI